MYFINTTSQNPSHGGELIKIETLRGKEETTPGSLHGAEEIPSGGWRGGEEIPKGGWRGGEEIPKGGWRSVRDVYRTREGDQFYEFEFHREGDHVEIDIIRTPSYGNRDSDPHKTHRIPSSRGGHKICFGDDSVISDMNKAREWAEKWAEHTSSYIKDGTPFPNQ